MVKKILLLGSSTGSYRNQNTIRYFTDRINEYAIIYRDARFTPIQIKCKSIICKIFRKLLNYIVYVLIRITDIFWIFQADIMYVLAMNHDKNLFKIKIAKFFGKKIVIDFYISMYDTLVLDRKALIEDSMVESLFHKEQKIMELADKLIFLNRSEQQYYCDLLQVDNTKGIIIPLCVDPHKYRKPTFSHNSEKNPIICWWGTYIPLHGLFNIIESVEILKNQGFQGKFYIFGDSEEKAKEYQMRVTEKKLQNEIIIINDYSFNNGKLEKFLYDNCDLALGSFGDSDKAKTVLINKVIDAISMKIPVLTMKTKALGEFFNFNNNIFVTDNGSPDEIAKSILYIFNNYEQAIENVENSYEIYLDTFSPKAYAKKLEEFFNDL